MERFRRRKPLNLKRASLRLLNNSGYLTGDVETRRGKFSFDLLGLFDLVALDRNGSITGVQVTDHTHFSKHVKDMRDEPNLKDWLSRGGHVELHIWKRVEGDLLSLRVYDCERDGYSFIPRFESILADRSGNRVVAN